MFIQLERIVPKRKVRKNLVQSVLKRFCFFMTLMTIEVEHQRPLPGRRPYYNRKTVLHLQHCLPPATLSFNRKTCCYFLLCIIEPIDLSFNWKTVFQSKDHSTSSTCFTLWGIQVCWQFVNQILYFAFNELNDLDCNHNNMIQL